jgi:hypothetical protein
MDEILELAGFLEKAKDANNAVDVRQLEAMLEDAKQKYYAEEKERRDPAREVGGVDAMLIGAGEAFDKMGRGAKALYARATGNDERLEELKAENQANDDALESLRNVKGGWMTAGGILPYLATAPLSPGTSARQIMSTAAVNAIPALLEYREDGADQFKNAGIDALLTALIPGGVQTVKAFRGVDDLPAKADELGYRLTPGEIFDSKTLRQVEASLESNPLMGGPLRDIKKSRQGVVNKVAAKAVGEESLGRSGVDAAHTRLGQMFDDVLANKESLSIDDLLIDALGNIESVTRRDVMGGGDTSKIIDNIVDAVAEGTISGEQLQTMRTSLGAAASKAARDDSSTQAYTEALTEMVGAIDDLIGRNLSPEEMAKWAASRKQYRALKQLENANAINEVGDVSGRKLGNYLQRTDKPGYLRGNTEAGASDLYEVARLSRAYAPLADSGTATRQWLQEVSKSPLSAALQLGVGRPLSEFLVNPTGLPTRFTSTMIRELLEEDNR